MADRSVRDLAWTNRLTHEGDEMTSHAGCVLPVALGPSCARAGRSWLVPAAPERRMIGRRYHRPKADGRGIGCLTVSERWAIETRIARINAVLRDLEDQVQRLRRGDKQQHFATVGTYLIKKAPGHQRLMPSRAARGNQRCCRPLIQVGAARTRRVRARSEPLHCAARSRCP